MKQPGFFDFAERLSRLNGLGDQLEAFSRIVDFETFRPDLKKALVYSDGSTGGRPPFDPVLMLKILVIQMLNNPTSPYPIPDPATWSARENARAEAHVKRDRASIPF